ncbi:MAG TPA: hypothetical protein VHV74_03950 [Pseudonocardiaceae bacterium]|nr:hypothetical protein [Pseudonocardiaceae bacterium]
MRGDLAQGRVAGLDPGDVLLQLSVLWRIKPDNGGQARAAASSN